MRRPRIIPTLLLSGNRLVKTKKFKDPTYIGDPLNAIRIFNDKEIDELIVIDITATESGNQPQFQLIEEFAGECFMPLCYGGGLNHIEDVKRIFDSGVEKVSFQRALIKNPSVVEQTAKLFGSQSVVASIDVKEGLFKQKKVVSLRGREIHSLSPTALAAEAVKLGAGEILLNSVDRDGTFTGYDLSLIKEVSQHVSVPVVAVGGCSSAADLAQALLVGASAAAAGSMFVYHGRLKGILINVPNEVTSLMAQRYGNSY